MDDTTDSSEAAAPEERELVETRKRLERHLSTTEQMTTGRSMVADLDFSGRKEE
jgi:hypothetical protein